MHAAIGFVKTEQKKTNTALGPTIQIKVNNLESLASGPRWRITENLLCFNQHHISIIHFHIRVFTNSIRISNKLISLLYAGQGIT